MKVSCVKSFFLIFLFLSVLYGSVFSFDESILFVTENISGSGTCLRIYNPINGEFSDITDPESDDFYRISFPVVCEENGMIAFTNHSESMEASVFIIYPDNDKPIKIVDKAILEDISPDGNFLLVSSASSSPSLYTVDIEKREVKRITEGYTVNSARYSPDGAEIVFAAMDSSGLMDLYEMDNENFNISRVTNTANWTEYYPSFTHDGEYLMFMTDRTGEWGVDYINVDSGERYQANLWGMYPDLSEDDSWATYEKDGEILVSKTTGKELSTLFDGMTPCWISVKNAGRFFGEEVSQTANIQDTVSDVLLISRRIDSTGGVIESPGKVKLEIPADTVDENSGGELKIFESSIGVFDGKIFEFEWENTPSLFSKMVTITIPLDKNAKQDEIIAVDEIGENTWVVIPHEYDAKNHSVKIETAHFSKKGIISEISPSQIRKIFSGAVGAFVSCGTIIFITGSTAITLPVTGAVVAGTLLFGATEAANPLLDKSYELYHGLNRTIAIDDGIYVSWVDDPNSQSNVPGEKYLICVDKSTRKILLFMDDPKLDPENRAAAMTALFPFSKYELMSVPKVIIELAAELKWIKNFYKEKGYELPPATDIWIFKMSASGNWNGTKLELNVEYFNSMDESVNASRMVVLAHEYWHSIYQHNGFSPDFKWLDECLATTFESQALLKAKYWFTNKILPGSEHFYKMYHAGMFAESMRSGFVFEGENGIDADRIKRGYRLWPWGKFILSTQGYGEINAQLNGEMDSKMLSSYFEQFCKSLLIKDFEIGDYIEENLIFEGKPVTYETVTGWGALNLKTIIGKAIIVPGNSGANISSGIFHKPIPLSLNVMNFKSALPLDQSPLIIRRNTPDSREEFLALNPYKTGDAAGRQDLADTESGDGILRINRNWFKSGDKSVEFPIAIINSAVEENWSEYFGYGENPIYAYFLKKPVNLKTGQNDNKIIFSWESPDFGYGLSALHCLSGYNIYLGDDNEKNIRLLNTLSPDFSKQEIDSYMSVSYTHLRAHET